MKLGAGEYHAWALAAEAGEAALAAEDPEEATRLADLAVELAGLVEGPEGWPEAVRTLALEHRAKIAQRLGKQV